MENQENATASRKAVLSPKQTLARVELQGLVLKSISTLAELLRYCRRNHAYLPLRSCPPSAGES